MTQRSKMIAASAVGFTIIGVVGCQSADHVGGYHSTSSEQNVGSRSSNGTYGGTSDDTGRAGGVNGPNAPATPYKNTAPNGNGGGNAATGSGSNGALIGPQNP